MSDNNHIDLISSFKLDHEGNEKKENELLRTANKYLLSQNSDVDLLKSVFNKIVSFAVITISFLYIQFVMPYLSNKENVILLVAVSLVQIIICFRIRNKLIKILRG